MDEITVLKFLENKEWWYDAEGQFIWMKEKDKMSIIVEIRGWAEIRNMLKGDVIAAAEFQDKLGLWIMEAIKEKIEKHEKD